MIGKFISDVLGPRNRDILFAVCGLHDGIERSMRSVGRDFGLTSERVRQIVAQAQGLFKSLLKAGELKQMERALKGKTPYLSNQPDELSRAIFTDMNCALSGVNNFFRLLGIRTGFQTVVWGRSVVLLEESRISKLPPWNQVASIARRIARNSGAVSPDVLRAAVINKFGLDESAFRRKDALVYLQSIPYRGTMKLSDGPRADIWFLLEDVPGPISRARECAQQLGKISISGTHLKGTLFSHSSLQYPIPESVFSWLLAQHGFEINGDEARLLEGISTQRTRGLSPTKRKMIDILKAAPDPMPRESFLEACIGQGISQNTAYVYLYRYEIFRVVDGMVLLAGEGQEASLQT